MDPRYIQLKEDLLDYYGTASQSGYPIAMVNLGEIEDADEPQLRQIAREANFNLDQYGIDEDELER